MGGGVSDISRTLDKMASTAPPELESPWADLSLGDICPAVELLGASELCGHYLALRPGQTGLVSSPH